jgi:serine/threonine protein kinase
LKAEADLMKTLRPHKNIVTLLGVSVPPDPMCIVLEFVTNGSMWDYLASDADISMDFNINCCKGIATGMLHLHQEGVIHREYAFPAYQFFPCPFLTCTLPP